MKKVTCPREECKHQWVPRVDHPKACPKCFYKLKLAIAKEEKQKGAEPKPMVGTVIKAFESVNPAYSTWYANKTQRAACERLLATYGLDKLLRVVALLNRTNTMPYFPVITSPMALEGKWTALEAAFLRIKSGEKQMGRGVA